MAWLRRLDSRAIEDSTLSGLDAQLTARGSTWDGVGVLVSASGATILRRAWVDSVLRTVGPVRLDLVSTSSWGAVASSTATEITITPGTWTAPAGVVRAWDRTTGAELGDATYTRVGAVLTSSVAAAVATAIGLGHVVDVWDTATELQVGGPTRDVRLEAGATARFALGLITTHPATGGDVGLACGCSSEHIVTADSIAIGTDAADCYAIGWRGTAGYAYCGIAYDGAAARATLVRSAAAIVYSGGAAITPANVTGWRALFSFVVGLGTGSTAVTETLGSVAATTAAGCAITAPSLATLWIHGVDSTGRITRVRALYT